MILSVNKYLYRFFYVLLLSTVLLHAEYGFGSTKDEVKVNRSLVAMKLKIAQQEERIDGLTTIIEGLSISLNELRYTQQKKPLPNEGQNSQDALLQKLAAMIDDINANYVSKNELQSLLKQHTPKKKTTSKKAKKASKQKARKRLRLTSVPVLNITSRNGLRPACPWRDGKSSPCVNHAYNLRTAISC